MSRRIVIVNDQDIPIGLTEYPERQYADIYRVTALWLADKKTGDVLLQQRKKTKHNHPGLWQCAVSGTVEEGETYEQNIATEIVEEIGLHDLEISEGPKTYIDDGEHRFFCQWFQGVTNKNTAKITIQESELERVRWIDTEVLLRELATEPSSYVPSMIEDLRNLGVIAKEQARTVIAIAKSKDWQAAQESGYYTKSTITSTLHDVGFLHCSFPEQTVDIANRHFHEYQELLLLLVDPLKLRSRIAYEGALSGREGTFPHIYGPLNIDAVYDTVPLLREKNGTFTLPEKVQRLIV